MKKQNFLVVCGTFLCSVVYGSETDSEHSSHDRHSSLHTTEPRELSGDELQTELKRIKTALEDEFSNPAASCWRSIISGNPSALPNWGNDN